MSAAALYGLIAWALLLGVATTFWPRCRNPWLAPGVSLAALLPLFGGESLAMACHGAFAAPSLTLLQVALLRLASPGNGSRSHYPCASPEGRRSLLPSAAVFFLAVAAVFYPLALGLGPFDPYALGYQARALLLALLPLAAWLAWRRQTAWLFILAFDLFAYALGLFGNLWDALLDPLLVLASLGALLPTRPGHRHKTLG